ncbi:hypothetical protein K1X76_12970 [bacterium]|nr:hypothetical protein [bacterium]
MKQWLLALLLLLSPVGMAAEMAQDDVDVDSLTPGSNECGNLKEQIDIFAGLADTVKGDLKKVKDPMLCESMATQCEDFNVKTKSYQKLYKQHCDDTYEIVKLEKCDYAETPCTKPVMDTPSPFEGLHASVDEEKNKITW